MTLLTRGILEGEKKSVYGWIKEADKFKGNDAMLDGRLFVICLGLVESSIYLREEILWKGTFLRDLIKELNKEFGKPIAKILSTLGAEKWSDYFIGYYNAPTHSDEPSLVDRLGRKPFAKVLEIKIQDYFNTKN